MNAPVHLDFGALVRQLPAGIVPAVRGVAWLVVGQKVPIVGIPESAGHKTLRSVVPEGEKRFEVRPVVLEILG